MILRCIEWKSYFLDSTICTMPMLKRYCAKKKLTIVSDIGLILAMRVKQKDDALHEEKESRIIRL